MAMCIVKAVLKRPLIGITDVHSVLKSWRNSKPMFLRTITLTLLRRLLRKRKNIRQVNICKKCLRVIKEVKFRYKMLKLKVCWSQFKRYFFQLFRKLCNAVKMLCLSTVNFWSTYITYKSRQNRRKLFMEQ